MARPGRRGLPPPGAAVPVLVAALLLGLALLPASVLMAAAWRAGDAAAWLGHLAASSLPAQARASAEVAAIAIAVAFACGALPAVAVARYRFAGRRVVALLALLPLLLPPSVSAGIWSVGFSTDALATRQALGLLQGLACGPFVFLVFYVAAARLPTSLDEMAAACGLGPWQRWWRLILPAYAVPAAAAALIVVAQAWGDFAAAERLGVQTLSLGLHMLWFASQRADLAAVMACLLLLPALLLVVMAARAALAFIGQAPGGTAAAAVRPRPLAALPTRLLWLWSALWALPAFFIPEGLVLRWAWQHAHRARLSQLPGDAANTLLSALAVLAVVLGLVLLVALTQRPGRRAGAVAWMPWLFLANFFLPSLVLALAFVLMSADGTALAGWLGEARDTRLLLVLATALRLAPFALLPVLDALRRTPAGLVEMARACGAGPLRARLQVFRGALAPALLLGGAVVFVEAVQELDLALTLQPFGYGALSLKIYAFTRNQNLDRAAFWVLASQACMLLPLLLLAARATWARRGPETVA